MKTREFQRVFLMLFINSCLKFKKNGDVDSDPPGVLAAKESWIGRETSVTFVDRFLFDFDITYSEEYFVKSSEINE